MPDDHPFQVAPSPSTKRPRSPILPVIVGILSVLLWNGLAVGVYVRVPRFAKMFMDFGIEVDPLFALLLSHGPFVFPLIPITALVVAMLAKSRRVWTFVLMWLPLLLGIGLAVWMTCYMTKLFNDLS